VNLKVIFISERSYRYYTQRRFELINLLVNKQMNFSRLIKNLFLKTGESRLIIHWSEFDWPDHGAPKNPEPFLQLLNDVRHCGAFDPRYGAPILHCSAGKNLFFNFS
jgi:protein tyrosine phosphatase